MQNLNDHNSVVKHENTSWRHEALSRLTEKGDKFILAIKPVRENLKSKHQALKDARRNQTVAHNKVRFRDSMLDNVLRTVHFQSKKYDQENPGENIRERLFPGGNMSPVITMPMSEEPDAVELMASTLEMLGSEHPLYYLVEKLRNAAAASKEAIAAYHESIKAVSEARNMVEFAKNDLRRRYARSYHEAAAEYGKDFAEMLFPEIYSHHSTVNAEEEQENEEDVA
jgi:hypothetical protein